MNNSDRILVWDVAVRVFHWSLVAGFFVAYFAEGEWLRFHIWAGYIVLALLCFRLVWGFIGPRYARFHDFVHRPNTVFRYLFAVLSLRAPRHIGHNPAGGAMIVALIVAVFVTAWSGLLLYGADAWLGPMAWLMKNANEESIAAVETLHGAAANFTVVLVLIHVGGVIWESLLQRENLVAAMLTGYKRLRPSSGG